MKWIKTLLPLLMLAITSLSGISSNNNIPIKTNPLTLEREPGMPYIEVGTTTYSKGSTDAVFDDGILLDDSQDSLKYYFYISNENFYNATSSNTSYTTFNDTLIFINIVFYKSDTGENNGFVFAIQNSFGAYLLTNNWANLQYFKIMINRYQTTNYFGITYEYQYVDYVSYNLVTMTNDTGLTNFTTPHYYFTDSLGGASLTSYLNHTFTFQSFGGLSEYGYNQGYSAGLDAGYSSGYDDGYDDGKADGIALDEQGAYDEGYNDGINESFTANLGDWIVPAIIVVLLLGGAISIWSYKKRAQ